MCAVAATHSTLVNNVLLILVVVLNALTAVSKSQVQNNLNLCEEPCPMQGFLLSKIHYFPNSINKKVRSKSTALFLSVLNAQLK
jgi:hypothetical protein